MLNQKFTTFKSHTNHSRDVSNNKEKMTLEESFIIKLNAILNVENFSVKKIEGGFLAVRKYELGEQSIFFESGKKWDGKFAVDINLWLTNEPVQNICALVNNRISEIPVIVKRLSFLTKEMNNGYINFERVKFNDNYGKYISNETLEQYGINLKICLKSLIIPFFKKFSNQNSFDNYINQPLLDGNYDFEFRPIWKEAIISLIVAKLVSSKDFHFVEKIWFNQDFPKGVGFDTKMELIKLKEILKNV